MEGKLKGIVITYLMEITYSWYYLPKQYSGFFLSESRFCAD